MAIKVYGSMLSTSALRVLLCLAEKDLDFELIHVDLASAEHKRPLILSRSPFAKIPAFEDGEIKLFESRAISQYISRAYAEKGTDLISKDPKKAVVESVWMEVESQEFDRATVKLVWQVCMKRLLFGKSSNQAVVDAESKKLERLLEVYEARLRESKYLGGERFSLADLYHAPVIKFLMETEMRKLFEARPRVNAWVADILSRPASVKVFVRQLPTNI